MAASKSYYPRANHRYLPADQSPMSIDSIIFELDESDVWSSAALPRSPEFRKPAATPPPIRATSEPVKVPDWAKILKHENRRIDGDDDAAEGGDDWVAPHEYLARNRIASLSVQEGMGRTLKGRDLSRVRNAIWQKTGFQD